MLLLRYGVGICDRRQMSRSCSVLSVVDHRPPALTQRGRLYSSTRLSDKVLDVLNTPDLETPEGMSAERMFSITEAFWKALKSSKEKKVKKVVHERADALDSDPEFDVCVCGGTLGIGLALGLQMQGQRVCVYCREETGGRSCSRMEY